MTLTSAWWPIVDVLLGNEEEFTACLGYEVPESGDNVTDLDPGAFISMIAKVAADFPALDVIATSLRVVRSASVNDWGAVAWSRSEGVAEATHRRDLDVLDRVGGGDSFASGLIFGLMTGRTLQSSVDLGASHGALAMTTPGDTSSATLAEVERLAAGGGFRVVR
jgi:2-dehydro-3-deoxygluconokinase